MNRSQKIFFEKNAFFDPKIGLFAHKLGQNGVHWGVYRVNFGFLRVPDPLGVEIMQIKKNWKKNLGLFWPKKDLEKFRAWPPPKHRPKWARKGPVGFWGPFLALLGPFLTPLGLSVGPNVYILSFWRYQNHLEPNEK